MLSKIALFELRYQLRSPLFLISCVLFALLTFAATTIDGVQIGGRGNVNLNSPFAILQIQAVMNLFAAFVVCAFVANVVIRDDECGFAPLIRSTRLGKADYLIGRFGGATLVAFLVTLASPLGILLGSWMPWLDAQKIGPLVGSHYVYAAFVFGLPSLLVLASCFFALATVTRSMMWSYVGVVAFLVLYTASRLAFRDPAYDTAAALSDPFGLAALSRATKYWTASERNTLLPPLQGLLLYNRLIWLGVSGALFALAYGLFRFDRRDRSSARDRARALKADPRPEARPLALPQDSAGTRWLQLRALTRFDMRFVFRSPAFFVLLALGLFNAWGALTVTAELRGVPQLPVTRAIVDALAGSFTIIPFIIAIYYGGELVWRDRERRIHEIVDACAAPNWAHLLPKVLAISAVLLACFVSATVFGLGFQLAHGYTDVQLGAHLLWFVLPSTIGAILTAMLSIFVQSLVPNKFTGWALMLVQLVAMIALGTAGWEHNLYNYAGMPTVQLSDMNGLGHFWIGRAWFQLYWLCFGGVLMVITHLLWRRGAETRLAPRFALARQRLLGLPGALLALLTLGFAATGGWIFYHTNVLNRYETLPEQEQLAADYEKTLLAAEALPEPTITHVDLDVALYPQQRRAEVSGRYALENRSGQPISTVHVQLPPRLKLGSLALDGATLQEELPRFNHRIYRLSAPLLTGERRELRFSGRVEEPGFVNDRAQTRIVDNGSFLANYEISPLLGINRNLMLSDRSKRRKHGLPADLRLAKLEDDAARAHQDLRHDSDWVTATITLSTDADQTPLAPGVTVSDTVANGRRTLITRNDVPINHFFSLQSARYAIAHDRWVPPGGQPVALSVYYHPAHAHNVQRMLDAMKVSLELFNREFSPYQFQQARILEFPAYASYAQSFANTVPYSEAIGFIQNFKEENQDTTIDQVTYVTAHEIAHQWWGHQLNTADKQGATLLTESFAQYSALLVMEKLYGKPQLRKFLKGELDSYLRARGGEAVEELPLARVENQPYIHYRKGALAMYGLKEAIGEEKLNHVLAQLLKAYAFKPAPYPDARDFLRLLRAQAGPEHQQLITDLFERITLYDLKARDAEVRRLADGRYELRVTVDARKLYADGQGHETEAPLEERFEIGAFSVEPGKKGYRADSVLQLVQQPLHAGSQRLTLVVDRVPAFVGVDPFNVRIDRNPDDNLTPVKLQP